MPLWIAIPAAIWAFFKVPLVRKIILAILAIWFVFYVMDHLNWGGSFVQNTWLGPSETVEVADTDGDNVPDSEDSAPNDRNVTLTHAQVTATAEASREASSDTSEPPAAATPTAEATSTEPPTETPEPTALPTMVAPTPEPTPAPDMVQCIINGAPVEMTRSQCMAGFPQNEEAVRQATGVPDFVQVLGTSGSPRWIFKSTQGEFRISLPAGACVEYDPGYEMLGQEMLPPASYGHPAVEDNGVDRKVVELVEPATLVKTSQATITWTGCP